MAAAEREAVNRIFANIGKAIAAYEQEPGLRRVPRSTATPTR